MEDPMPAHVDLPQGRIRYDARGDGRPVVCVHAYLTGGDVWDEFAVALAPRGYQVITPTWPLGAHLDAVQGDHDRGPRGVAATVADFLQALDLDDVVLVGNDTGGAIAQVVATTRPNRLGALVLTNCDAFDRFPPPPFTLLRPLARAGLLPAVLATMRAGWVRRSPLGFGLLSHANLDDRARRWVAAPLADPQVMADIVALTTAIDPAITLEAAAALPAFDRPTLIAWAADDRLFPLHLAERLAATIPDATLQRVQDSRTFAMVDQPGRLAEMVDGFLRRTGHADVQPVDHTA
jgi:pimeloyl-ACP methyl ester carboxylesterase